MTDDVTHKFVVVLNKKISIGSLMNVLGHMAAGLAGSYPNVSEMRFNDYFDKDGGKHPSISDNPFIILSADNLFLGDFPAACRKAVIPAKAGI